MRSQPCSSRRIGLDRRRRARKPGKRQPRKCKVKTVLFCCKTPGCDGWIAYDRVADTSDQLCCYRCGQTPSSSRPRIQLVEIWITA